MRNMTKEDEALARSSDSAASTSKATTDTSSAVVKSEPNESRAVEMPLKNSETVEIPCRQCDEKFETQCDSDQHFQLYHMKAVVVVKRLNSDDLPKE